MFFPDSLQSQGCCSFESQTHHCSREIWHPPFLFYWRKLFKILKMKVKKIAYAKSHIFSLRFPVQVGYQTSYKVFIVQNVNIEELTNVGEALEGLLELLWMPHP